MLQYSQVCPSFEISSLRGSFISEKDGEEHAIAHEWHHLGVDHVFVLSLQLNRFRRGKIATLPQVPDVIHVLVVVWLLLLDLFVSEARCVSLGHILLDFCFPAGE